MVSVTGCDYKVAEGGLKIGGTFVGREMHNEDACERKPSRLCLGHVGCLLQLCYSISSLSRLSLCFSKPMRPLGICGLRRSEIGPEEGPLRGFLTL